ncbi:MAG: hypothetical protein JSV97_04315 [candidate division WOR-3 bacterium]|nr:MAG: hypothetical protein JSV97_04315 [candidate division WOR-3 bacterium]
MAKAIALLSGGLDSTLAVKMMLEQNIDVSALNFITPFCTCTKKGCKNHAKKLTDMFGIELKIIRLKNEYIDLVKNPLYGYGKNMNPCIDCRIFMFSRAREYMYEIGASFVFTGEVLGERPMSQRREAMRIIEKESGLNGRLLRPLCATFLEPTIPEIEGIVDRSRLLAITGRSRKPQISLAKEKGINDYPCPAGGCRLTDPHFAKRLKEAFEHGEDSVNEIILLRHGRHFRLSSGAKVVVGRNEGENKVLSSIAAHGNILLLETKDYVGPITLLYKYKDVEDIQVAANLCLTYSDYRGKKAVEVKIGDDSNILAMPLSAQQIEALHIRK